MRSPNGKTYSERLNAARSEKELSAIFEDFIGMVPMGRTLFGGFNPVHTGGPMQVSIDFAEEHAEDYPYPVDGSIRREVFSRRGGMYFGIAHLLGYPVSYKQPLYRFADFNAGWYASRNAAFQNAVSRASGIPLALDGDLVRYDSIMPGTTELAVRTLGKQLGMRNPTIRDRWRRAKASNSKTPSSISGCSNWPNRPRAARCRARCCRGSCCRARRSPANSPRPGSPNGSTSVISGAWRGPGEDQKIQPGV